VVGSFKMETLILKSPFMGTLVGIKYTGDIKVKKNLNFFIYCNRRYNYILLYEISENIPVLNDIV